MEAMEAESSLERAMIARARETKTPINGSIELLPLCNMNCGMCYVRLSRQEMERQGRLRGAEEWLALARQMEQAGVLFLLLTGGEPLLQPGAADFLAKVRELGFAVKLDTNGCFPKILANILDRGLVDYVAMDIKNSPEKYPETVGIPGFDTAPVEESVRLLAGSGVDHEFRTTLVREFHTAEDLTAIGRWLPRNARYFLQAFVDSGNLIGQGYHGFAAQEMRDLAALVRPLLPRTELRGAD